jgi:type IV secretion system protein VirB1
MLKIRNLILAFLLVVTPVIAQAVESLSPQVLALARRCAPDVDALTIAYLVSAESRNNPLAINVNGKRRKLLKPVTVPEARERIRALAEEGLNYDVGYAQINSSNFQRLGLSGAQLLDGCINLRAAAQILGDCYGRAAQVVGEGQAALRRALSCYNTGSQHRGFTNGYVARVVAQIRLKVPALVDGASNASRSANVVSVPSPIVTNSISVTCAAKPSDTERQFAHRDELSHVMERLTPVRQLRVMARPEADMSRSTEVDVYRAYIPPSEVE